MICIRSSSEINFIKTPAGATERGRSARSKKKGLYGRVETECSLYCEGLGFFDPETRRCIVGLEIPVAGGHTPACGRRMGGHELMMLRSECLAEDGSWNGTIP